MEILNVKTVRGAKHYIKYHRSRDAEGNRVLDFPQGAMIFGYDTDEHGEERQVYCCEVRGQHEKLPGGRRCFSDREQVLEDLFGNHGHYPKGTECDKIFIRPKYFKVVHRNGG